MDDITTPFAWSYSRLKGFEDCPHRYFETQVKKGAWPEDSSPQLDWGDAVHKALANALRTGTPLPTIFKLFQHWVDDITALPGELLIEDDCRWAIDRNFKPVPWFAKTVWLRTVADAVKLHGNVGFIVDWKAGKSANVDPIQLILTSLMMLVQFPKLKKIHSMFVWLQEDHQTVQTLTREEAADQWSELMPRVKKLEKAYREHNFPATPNRFCRRWCPVKSCEFWGK